MLARLELNGNLAPIQQYGRHQRRANTRKKGQGQGKKKSQLAEGADEAAAQTAADVGNSGEKNEKKEKADQFDDKFYDLDDGFICDEEIDQNDDGVLEFVNESESQSAIGSTVQKGPNGETLNDEEQRLRRTEKKELEKMAKRFKVITPAEFERNLQLAMEVSGGEKKDVWAGGNQNSGNMSDVPESSDKQNNNRNGGDQIINSAD